jgi:hypothetical protein
MARDLNNLSVLISKPQTIRIGIVKKALKSSRWQIESGRSRLLATSSIKLFPGQRVVIGQTNEGWAVVDSGAFSAVNATEIRIAG